jgi:hypothetical protein
VEAAVAEAAGQLGYSCMQEDGSRRQSLARTKCLAARPPVSVQA